MFSCMFLDMKVPDTSVMSVAVETDNFSICFAVNKSQFAECTEEGNWQQTVDSKWITFGNFYQFNLVTDPCRTDPYRTDPYHTDHCRTDPYRTWNVFVEPTTKFLCMK